MDAPLSPRLPFATTLRLPGSTRKRLYPSTERRLKHAARYATISAAFKRIFHRTESAFIKVLDEAATHRNTTRRAENAPQRKRRNPPVHYARSFCGTSSSGFIDTNRVSSLRTIKKRVEQKGPREHTKRRACVAGHRSSTGAPSEPAANIKPLKIVPKRRTGHESELTASRSVLGNTAGVEESGHTVVPAAVPVAAVPCQSSDGMNLTTLNDDGGADFHVTASPLQRPALRDEKLERSPPPMLRNLSPDLEDSTDESDCECFMNEPKVTFYVDEDLSLIIYTPRSDITLWDGRKGLENANNGPAVVKAKDGVHIDKSWQPVQDKDGVCGWFANGGVESVYYEGRGVVQSGADEITMRAELNFNMHTFVCLYEMVMFYGKCREAVRAH
ncbi:hypothetical protein BKA82DRAFT_4012216 [Pisolithus tinctorius]|nr:hypothetical protein BKA82DRAFT_4012216 [Pisolithus tinctorius]